MSAADRPPLPSGVASLTARQLGDAISRLEGRAAQALTLRLLEARTRPECAAFFGISPRAFDVMLLRAALALEGVALPGPRRPPLPSAEERIQAAALAEALEPSPPPTPAAPPPASPLDPEVRRLGQLLRHLRELAGELRAQLEQAAREEESSPRARRGVWTRRVLMMLLIAAALYLYQRERATRRDPASPGSLIERRTPAPRKNAP